MSQNSLRRFYCCLPISQKETILSTGINPRRLTGGEALRVFHSKDQVEKQLKTQLSGLIVIIDAIFLRYFT